MCQSNNIFFCKRKILVLSYTSIMMQLHISLHIHPFLICGYFIDIRKLASYMRDIGWKGHRVSDGTINDK